MVWIVRRPSRLEAEMKQIPLACLVALLFLGVGVTRSLAQDAVKDTAKKTGEATKEGTKKAGEATKEGTKKAGEATVDGTKKAGEVTKEGAKKAGDATASGTKTAAKATTDTTKSATKATTDAAGQAGTGVKNVFTGDVNVMCNDGKKHSGKTNEAACEKYGGVKK
jgi:hypothetical protein